MARPVARLCSGDSTPGTDGTVTRADSPRRTGVSRLLEVEDDTLPDDGIEDLLGCAGDPRGLHEIPDQQPVVRLRQRIVVVVDADSALEPPVRRVQRVGVVGA